MQVSLIARFAAILTILSTVTAIPSGRAMAQGDPGTISGLTANRTPFTNEESARIRAFGEHWVARMTRANAPPRDVDDARRRLMEPLRGRGQSDLFLGEYADVVLPGLVTAIDGADTSPHVTANALVIISRAGTERALDALIDRASSRQTNATHVRLGAARGARELLRQADTNRISVRKRQQVARRLREAAAAESDPFVLRHHLHAIFYCDHDNVDNEARAELLGHLSGALTAVAGRASESVLLLDATSPIVFEILREFLRRDLPAQTVTGRALTPGMMRLLEAYQEHAWSAPVNDTGPDRGRFARQIARIERSLQTMLPFAHPGRSVPASNLEAAWLANDADRFRSELDLWKQATR